MSHRAHRPRLRLIPGSGRSRRAGRSWSTTTPRFRSASVGSAPSGRRCYALLGAALLPAVTYLLPLLTDNRHHARDSRRRWHPVANRE
jgi:hypothetical protein